MKPLRYAVYVLRYLGPHWIWQRIQLAFDLRSGRLARRLPIGRWADVDLSSVCERSSLTGPNLSKHKPRFFFEPGSFSGWEKLFLLFDRNTDQNPISKANAILTGQFELFSAFSKDLGFPPCWNLNPMTGERAPKDVHFSELNDFAFGDIKAIWEPSRFSFAFTLSRAYARTADDRYPEAFWKLFEDWCEQNQPNAGVNWKCGQEAAVRLFAWVFAYVAFSRSATTTQTRRALFEKAVFVTAERIRGHIDYALSQRNNHGISEAAGLFTAGILFPHFRNALQWKRQGAVLLDELAADLFDEDGGFSQNSFNYERVALHIYHWAVRLGDLNGESFSESSRTRLNRAIELLYQHQDPNTGSLPNYGHNDGALILPLTNSAFPDYRPVIQTGRFLHGGERAYGPEPSFFDEELLWLYGSEALNAPYRLRAQKDFAAAAGGYFVFRGRHSFLSCRVPRFRHRPSHADILHVDIWFDGVNVASDPGTYSYNSEAPWNNSLDQTVYHNTITINEKDQMGKASKFLWLPWIGARVTQNRSSESFNYFEAETMAYSPAGHARAIVRLSNDIWIILDRVTGASLGSVCLQWLFPFGSEWDEADCSMRIPGKDKSLHFGVLALTANPPRVSVVSADAKTPRGWISRYYLVKEPATSLRISAREEQLLFCSIFSPQPAKATLTPATLVLSAPGCEATLNLSQQGLPIVTSIAPTDKRPSTVPKCTLS